MMAIPWSAGGELTTHPDISFMDLRFHPVTPDRWPDLERLFGPRGANSGCWCLWWRLSRAEFDRCTADERKAGLKELVDAGRPPGILAYLADEPIAWVSLGPREDFGALERSRVLKRVDDQPVWSIVYFFVDKRYRRQGLMVRLLQGAVGYAAANGAQTVEGYPVDPGGEQVSGGSTGYVGLVSA
jgi:GNAT superfamily N-acetyltransferase